MEGWRVASKRLGVLPRVKRGALGRGCGREGSVVLPLPRAAAVSTGLSALVDAPSLAVVGDHAERPQRAPLGELARPSD